MKGKLQVFYALVVFLFIYAAGWYVALARQEYGRAVVIEVAAGAVAMLALDRRWHDDILGDDDNSEGAERWLRLAREADDFVDDWNWPSPHSRKAR